MKSYVKKIAHDLQTEGFRVSSDLRNEKITYKIREHSIQRVPYLLIVGDKEVENKQVAVRSRGVGDVGTMSIGDFLAKLKREDKRH